MSRAVGQSEKNSTKSHSLWINAIISNTAFIAFKVMFQTLRLMFVLAVSLSLYTLRVSAKKSKLKSHSGIALHCTMYI
jgi:hypothetical protein